MKRHTPWLSAALVACLAAGLTQAPVGAGEPPLTVVICAPGYPGSTDDAQPTMDQFASHLSTLAGWPAGHVQAVYHENEAAGVARMREADAVVAMVPLPFFIRHGSDLNLRPLLSGEQESGSNEVWSLVARRGRLQKPADLSGWEVLGQPCYAPRLVRGPVLSGWGEIPADVTFTFAPRVLSALRRAAAEDQVAVLLDKAQAEAMKALPLAADLEVVARSKPLPATLICALDDHADAADVDKLAAALRSFHEEEEGRAVLAEAQTKRFRPLDEKGLQRVNSMLADLPESP